MNYRTLLESLAYIRKQTNKEPNIGMILGSGLGVLTESMVDKITIPFEDIPYFPKPSVEGHSGNLVIGYLEGVLVAACSGRYHYYEGLSLEQVTLPVRLLKMIGVKTLLLTNSCGAVNLNFHPGELMVITDHINLTANNPLIGKNINELGPRFPDASNIYTKHLIELAKNVSTKHHIKLQEGIYAWWTGPSYETPAEIKMIRTLGADAIGMSTVPEALVASHMNMDVLGISLLTNMAAGILPVKLSHQDVLEVALSARNQFEILIKNLITAIL